MHDRYIKDFLVSECGAVTVDWVVLTAAIVGLGVSVVAYVSTGTLDLAEKIEDALTPAD